MLRERSQRMAKVKTGEQSQINRNFDVSKCLIQIDARLTAEPQKFKIK